MHVEDHGRADTIKVSKKKTNHRAKPNFENTKRPSYYCCYDSHDSRD